MVRLVCTAVVPVVAAFVATASVRADSAADVAAITQRLQQWTAAFNAKDLAGVRDLLPPISSTRFQIQQGTKEMMCNNLDKVLARPDLQLQYDNPDVPRNHRGRRPRRSEVDLEGAGQWGKGHDD